MSDASMLRDWQAVSSLATAAQAALEPLLRQMEGMSILGPTLEGYREDLEDANVVLRHVVEETNERVGEIVHGFEPDPYPDSEPEPEPREVSMVFGIGDRITVVRMRAETARKMAETILRRCDGSDGGEARWS